MASYGEGFTAIFRHRNSCFIDPKATEVGVKRAKLPKDKAVVFGYVQLGQFRKDAPVKIIGRGDHIIETKVLEAYKYIAGVAFYGIDNAVLDLFDNADVVGDAVLTAFFTVRGRISNKPTTQQNHAKSCSAPKANCRWQFAVVPPLPSADPGHRHQNSRLPFRGGGNFS